MSIFGSIISHIEALISLQAEWDNNKKTDNRMRGSHESIWNLLLTINL